MLDNNQVETPNTASNTLPKELRKSHWEARLRDIIENHGTVKYLATKYPATIIGSHDPISARSRLFSILNHKASVETAAETVMALEKEVAS